MSEEPRENAELQRQADFVQARELLSELGIVHYFCLLVHQYPVFCLALCHSNPSVQHTYAGVRTSIAEEHLDRVTPQRPHPFQLLYDVSCLDAASDIASVPPVGFPSRCARCNDHHAAEVAQGTLNQFEVDLSEELNGHSPGVGTSRCEAETLDLLDHGANSLVDPQHQLVWTLDPVRSCRVSPG